MYKTNEMHWSYMKMYEMHIKNNNNLKNILFLVLY